MYKIKQSSLSLESENSTNYIRLLITMNFPSLPDQNLFMTLTCGLALAFLIIYCSGYTKKTRSVCNIAKPMGSRSNYTKRDSCPLLESAHTEGLCVFHGLADFMKQNML